MENNKNFIDEHRNELIKAYDKNCHRFTVEAHHEYLSDKLSEGVFNILQALYYVAYWEINPEYKFTAETLMAVAYFQTVTCTALFNTVIEEMPDNPMCVGPFGIRKSDEDCDRINFSSKKAKDEARNEYHFALLAARIALEYSKDVETAVRHALFSYAKGDEK